MNKNVNKNIIVVLNGVKNYTYLGAPVRPLGIRNSKGPLEPKVPIGNRVGV